MVHYLANIELLAFKLMLLIVFFLEMNAPDGDICFIWTNYYDYY